jgi:uncharacterized protein (TIGR03067 family)
MNVLFAALLLAVVEPPADPTKLTPEQMLQGTWKLVSAQRRGENVPAKEVEGLRVVITGKKLIVKEPKRSEVATFKVDTTKKPLAIDLTSEKNPDKAVLGIFEVKGDTLKLCWAKSGGPRPTEFSTKKGADEVLFVLRREKK